MSSPSNHNITTTPVKSSSCLKMASLATSSASSSSSSQTSSSAIVNGHCCSIGHQSGNSGLAPIMEIREMNSYCNSCVGADKYWNPHHHGTPPLVATNVARHSVVYPQMFYTPPPPPPPNYSGVGGAPSHDWSCPPPATADSYSHFIYSQYPPPPPPQHDYGNFLGISSSWSAETEMIMMGAGPAASSQLQLSVAGNSCEPPMPPTQSMMSSFMYSAPPLQPPAAQVSAYESHINSTLSPSISVQQQKPDKPSNSESYHRTPSSSSTSSTVGDSSTDDSDDDETDDEEDSKHISIEDDDNESIVEDEISLSADDASLCLLCKKFASGPALSQTAPSPQLSRILENIDEDELDISVCSGDIEIGGIEDEMIQQVTEQHKISVQKLSQLVGVPVAELITQGNQEQSPSNCTNNEDQDALLCFKCQKLIGMAESLEKQLNSVLSTLKQQVHAFSGRSTIEGPATLEHFHVTRNSVAVQTDDDNNKEYFGKFMLVSKTKNETYSIKLSDPISNQFNSSHQSEKNQTPGPILGYDQFLCHECGRIFRTRRNLGKHLKRQHYEAWHFTTTKKGTVLTCSRENCGKTCYDQAALQIHLRKHTSEKPYFCTKCLKLFTTKSNLTAHVKSKVCQSNGFLDHSSDATISSAPEEPFSSNSADSTTTDPTLRCEHCGLTFRTETRFETHVKTRCNKSKLFQCDICAKPFVKRSELQAHQVVHTRTKSFPCDICGLAFSTKGNQRVHQRTHLHEKRFKCQECDKCFTRKQTLQAHVTHNHTQK